MRHLVYLGLLILLVGCSQSQPAVQPSPSADVQMKPVGSVAAVRPPGAPRVPVAVDGTLDSRTEPFRLDDGRYAITWSVTPRTDGSCIGSLTLKSPDQPTFDESIVSGIDARNTPTGTTQSYGVKAGNYYISSISNCPAWTVTFTPA